MTGEAKREIVFDPARAHDGFIGNAPTNRGVRLLCSLLILALALPWAGWIARSPMMRFSDKFTKHVFFPADGPDDRFQYFRHLVISHDNRVRYATCVLCSVTVNGSVDRATALWGD